MLSYPLVYFLNTHGVFVLLICVLGYLWFIKRSREQTIHIIVTVFIASALALILKELFNIPRPYIVQGLEAMAGYSVRTASLPSLHTTVAFALATIMTLHNRRLGIVLFLIAALIGFGRIAANVHYPIDIFTGAILGSVVALFVENLRIPKHRKRGA